MLDRSPFKAAAETYEKHLIEFLEDHEFFSTIEIQREPWFDESKVVDIAMAVGWLCGEQVFSTKYRLDDVVYESLDEVIANAGENRYVEAIWVKGLKFPTK